MFEDLHSVSSTHKDIQSFSRVVGGAVVLLGGIAFYMTRSPYARYMFIGGGVVTLLGVCAPNILRPLQRAWMMGAALLGWVMTRVILGVLFFAVLTPIGFFMRVFGMSFMNDGGREPNPASYWKPRERGVTSRERYEQQF